MHPRIPAILAAAGRPDPPIRPTALYNEGWLLNLLLDWAQAQAPPGHGLHFLPGARWFSDALLPSVFRARTRGDPLAESRTHADGVIGQFEIGRRGKSDLALNSDCAQFVVLEAKLMSPLSAGTRHSPWYDQAARNVACMAEVLCAAQRPPAELARLAFIVVAARENILQGSIRTLMDRGHLGDVVRRRAAAYQGSRDSWFEEWFLPTLDHIRLEVHSWEDLTAEMGPDDRAFYVRCLEYA